MHSKKTLQTLAVIPARYQSSRFPGKPLALIDGVPMLVRVVEQVKQSACHHIVVATDDTRIEALCNDHHIAVAMTRSDHKTGTDRIWEVAQGLAQYDIVVNVVTDYLGLEKVKGNRKCAKCGPCFKLANSSRV